MKHLEQLSEALRELTDRYGITITEVPERLREKILNKTGNEAGDDLDIILKPLLANMLRPLRIRAGQRVDRNVVAETVSSIAELEGYDRHLAETVVDLWASVFHVNVGDFPGLAAEKSARQNLMKEQADQSAADGRTPEMPKTKAEAARSEAIGRENRRQEAAQKTRTVAEPSEIIVKTSFADNRKTADFLSTGNKPTPEKKNPKKSERLESSTIVPLQPDMMSYTPPAAPDQSGSKKPGIDEAFRSLRNGEYQLASKIMMELARSGDTRAQYHLGEFYLMGTGVEQSNDKAKYWFRKAAAHGSLPARNKLADLEEPEGQTGCLGCGFVVFLVAIVLKFLSAVL